MADIRGSRVSDERTRVVQLTVAILSTISVHIVRLSSRA